MRKAITENTELNTRPILVLEIDFHKKIAYIKNFSNFPAYNFQIEDHRLLANQSVKGTIFQKNFPILDVIPPKDKIEILDSVKSEGDHVFFSSLNPNVRSNIDRGFTFIATASYDDISSNSWEMTIGYSSGNIIASKPQKVQRRRRG